MRKKYQVIALDMDGTVLNDKKEVGQRTRAAIHKALAAGREVVFCTGRSYAEMGGILQEFPDMHYLCGESGALLYDLKKNVPLKLLSIPEREISRIRETIAGRDIMPHFISEGRSIVNCAQLRRMEYYQMGAYQSAYLRTAIEVTDVFQMAEEEKCSVEKINLFHTNSKEREKTRKDLEQQQLFMNPNLKITDLVTALGTNRSAISACINSQRDCTFPQFVNTYRVARAQELLRNEPDIKIAEVWVKAGFSSEASFYRIFKAFTGTTPIAWKAEVH